MTKPFDDADRDAIVARLKRFFDDMAEWEAECDRQFRRVRKGELKHDEVHEQRLAALKELFREHCTAWTDAVRARKGVSYNAIPVYGSHLEDILSVEVTGKKAKVLTRQKAGFQLRLVYRLKKVEGQWKIEDNRKSVDRNGKEDRYML